MILARLSLFLLVATSCSRTPLSVETEYFRPKDLASYIIDTPDPEKEANVFGQRIRVSWWTSQEQYVKAPLAVAISVRLKNGDLLQHTYPLSKRTGELLFPVVGENFTQRGGILSYKIELFSGETLLAETKHRFWVEQIKVKE